MPGKDGCTVKSTMRDMTVGSPAKQILLFTLPLLAGNFLQQLYNIADTVIVGKAIGIEVPNKDISTTWWTAGWWETTSAMRPSPPWAPASR